MTSLPKEKPAKPAKTPKKEKPVDPIMTLARVHVHAREVNQKRMPPLRPNGPVLDRPDAELIASSVRQLDHLDSAIQALNDQKVAVYGVLRSRGINVKALRETVKERRIDPIMREEIARRRETYWAAIAAALETEEAAIAEASDDAA